MLVTESRPGQNRHAGVSSASACNSHRIAHSCVQGAHSVRPRLGFFFFFLRPGRKLFTADSHRATNICEMARGGAPAFMRGLPEERGFPSASSFSRDNRKARRSGEQGGKKNPPRCMRLGTSFRSPAITKETARSCRLHRGRNGLDTTMRGGPLTSSAVHHIIKIPARASLAMARNSLIRGSIKKPKVPGRNPLAVLFLIQSALLSTGHRLDFSQSSHLIAHT